MDEAAFAAWLGVKVEAEDGLKYSLTKPTIALFEAMYKGCLLYTSPSPRD